jgi:hypothetical protein
MLGYSGAARDDAERESAITDGMLRDSSSSCDSPTPAADETL